MGGNLTKTLNRLENNDKRLRSVTMSAAGVGDKEVLVLANALKNNQHVKELYLDSNSITDQGALYISECLLVNDTLLYLGLGGNKLTDTGVGYLCDALRTNTVLNDIWLYDNPLSHLGLNRILKMLPHNPTVVVHLGQRHKKDHPQLVQAIELACAPSGIKARKRTWLDSVHTKNRRNGSNSSRGGGDGIGQGNDGSRTNRMQRSSEFIASFMNGNSLQDSPTSSAVSELYARTYQTEESAAGSSSSSSSSSSTSGSKTTTTTTSTTSSSSYGKNEFAGTFVEPPRAQRRLDGDSSKWDAHKASSVDTSAAVEAWRRTQEGSEDDERDGAFKLDLSTLNNEKAGQWEASFAQRQDEEEEDEEPLTAWSSERSLAFGATPRSDLTDQYLFSEEEEGDDALADGIEDGDVVLLDSQRSWGSEEMATAGEDGGLLTGDSRKRMIALEVRAVELSVKVKQLRQENKQMKAKQSELDKMSLDELLKLNGKLLEAQQRVMGTVRRRLLCNVCFDRQGNVILKPCGHVFCNGCARQLELCAACRTSITSTERIFLV